MPIFVQLVAPTALMPALMAACLLSAAAAAAVTRTESVHAIAAPTGVVVPIQGGTWNVESVPMLTRADPC